MKVKHLGDGFPLTVKIGWVDYRIDEWSRSEATAAARYGETRHPPRVIAIDRSHGDRDAANTLLHEIMHAVCNVWHVDAEDVGLKEEAWVSPMSQGLSTVWRDNPTVFAWIAKHLTAP